MRQCKTLSIALVLMTVFSATIFSLGLVSTASDSSHAAARAVPTVYTPRLPASSPTSQDALRSFGHFPISFELNQGQVQSKVRFLAQGAGYSLFFTPTEAVLVLSSEGQASATTPGRFSPAASGPTASAPAAVVGMQFLDANPQPAVTGEQLLPGTVNYFLGNDPAKWHTNVPTYAQVRYHNLYPGIDLVYYGNQGQLEYDFIVAPGSDASRIHLGFSGTDHLSLDAQGKLLLHLAGGTLPEGAPQVYQEINGARQAITSRYVLEGASQVGFALGAYNPHLPLVIDPAIVYSTYLSGTNPDGSEWTQASNVAVDSYGNAYVTGTTGAPDFPLQNPEQPVFGGTNDTFVTKFNTTGSALIYSTFWAEAIRIRAIALQSTVLATRTSPGTRALLTSRLKTPFNPPSMGHPE